MTGEMGAVNGSPDMADKIRPSGMVIEILRFVLNRLRDMAGRLRQIGYAVPLNPKSWFKILQALLPSSFLGPYSRASESHSIRLGPDISLQRVRACHCSRCHCYLLAVTLGKYNIPHGMIRTLGGLTQCALCGAWLPFSVI
jgi:hypothetical protein